MIAYDTYKLSNPFDDMNVDDDCSECIECNSFYKESELSETGMFYVCKNCSDKLYEAQSELEILTKNIAKYKKSENKNLTIAQAEELLMKWLASQMKYKKITIDELNTKECANAIALLV